MQIMYVEYEIQAENLEFTEVNNRPGYWITLGLVTHTSDAATFLKMNMQHGAY